MESHQHAKENMRQRAKKAMDRLKANGDLPQDAEAEDVEVFPKKSTGADEDTIRNESSQIRKGWLGRSFSTDEALM